jgi:PST family polysaccharide transporter
VRGGAALLVAEAFDFALRIVSVVVLARMLAPEHFGLLAMVTAVTAIAERFKDLGLAAATVQRESITAPQISTLFWMNVAVGAALMLCVGAMAPLLVSFYGDPRLHYITLALAVGFLFGGLVVQHQALLRRQMRFGALAAIQIGASLISVALAVVAALLDYGYWALVIREVSRSMLVALGTWVALPWVPAGPSRGTGTRVMVKFGWDVTAFNFVWFLSSNFDQILIGRLFGASVLGLYRQGVNLVLAPIGQLTFPINSVAEAGLSRLRNHPEDYRRYFSRTVATISCITMPAAAFLAVFAEPIVIVVLGEKWKEATPFFQLFAISILFRPAVAVTGAVLISSGMSRRYLHSGMIGGCGLVACVAAGAPWGALGIAWGHVAYSYLLLPPIIAWIIRGSPVRLKDLTQAMVRPLIATGLAGLALLSLRALTPSFSPVAQLAAGAAAAPILVLGLWATLPGGLAEIQGIVKGAKGLLRRQTQPSA